MTANTRRKVFQRNCIVGLVDNESRISIIRPINSLLGEQVRNKLRDVVYNYVKIATWRHTGELVKYPAMNAVTEELYRK